MILVWCIGPSSVWRFSFVLASGGSTKMLARSAVNRPFSVDLPHLSPPCSFWVFNSLLFVWSRRSFLERSNRSCIVGRNPGCWERRRHRHGWPREVTHRLHEYFGGQLPLKIFDSEVPSDLLIYRHLSVLVHENKRHRVAAVNVKKNVTGRTGDLHRYLCRHLLHM